MSMPPPDEPVSTFYTRRQVIEMDYKFCLAMIEARRAGLEKFSIGIVVDDTPFTPTHFEREPPRSIMSSTAALCVESADFLGARGAGARGMRLVP